MKRVFGLGIPEILFIALLAVLILGPEHMPRVARMLGEWSGKIRSAATSLHSVVREDEDLRELQHNFQTVRNELSSAKQELLQPVKATEEVVETGRRGLDRFSSEIQSMVSSEKFNPHESEADGHVKAEVPGQGKDSDFMHRPLSWFADSGSHESGSACVGMRLPRPKALSHEISAQAGLDIMALPEAGAVPDKSGLNGIELSSIKPGRALICSYPLRRINEVSDGFRRISLRASSPDDSCILRISLPAVR